jgi:acetyl-CoA C-acetyltransferase
VARSVIVSAVRTPFGRLGGGLAGYEATDLGAVAIRGALNRVDVQDTEVEYLIMGRGGRTGRPASFCAWLGEFHGEGSPREGVSD